MDAMTSRAIAVVVLTIAAACSTGSTDSPDSTEPPESPESTESTSAPTSSSTGSSTSSSTTTSTVAPPVEHAVIQFDGEVVDPARDRRIPYRIYAPADADGEVPVILVSHGGDGSEIGYTTGTHLGSTFAKGGFLAVHIGHRRSAVGVRHLVDRPADVSFVLDQLEAGTLPLPAAWAGTADLDRVGHTGHSFGAYTAHAVAGADYGRSFRDARIDAIAPISPQGPDQFGAFDNGPGDSTWSTVATPVYNLIGGDEIDSNAVDSITRPGWRLVPFQRYPGTADTFQTVIAGQDHSDMWRTGSADVEQFVASQILAFFQVYVAGDDAVDPCSIGATGLELADTERRPASTGSSTGSRIAGCE
jgi:poly(3-hydroxybutyrate) depolymerase